MSILETMEEVARKRKSVKVICTDGEEFSGEACLFSPGCNEDDGYATMGIQNENGLFGLRENEIKSIEVV